MKLLFLEIYHERDWAVAAIGPAFMASYLRQNGHDVVMEPIDFDLSTEQVIQRIEKHAPDLIGLSLTSRQWQRAHHVVAAFRKQLDIPVITGGLHPTFAPENVLSHPGFDFVCLGEGEDALLDVMNAMASGKTVGNGDIDNIWVRGGTRPKLRPPYEPIDALPFMARDMLNERHGVTHMVTQRGCPFPCTYCAARKFHDLYGGIGTYGRRRSHENVLAEIRALDEAGLVSYITFLDDTFTLAPSWVSEFCKQYKDEFGFPFSLHARAETVNAKMLAELADAGCMHITYGVESGSERVRRDIMKRIVSNEHLLKTFKITRDAGILVTANYILGTPGETYDEVLATMALHEKLQPDDFGYFVFYPYPGTSLFHDCEAKGYLPDDYWTRPANHRETILNLPDLSQEQVGELYDMFTALRQADYLKKHGQQLGTTGRDTYKAQLSTSASQG
jgi:anaerobic magnesium-protoporphyrin IX monomethyl ester cyclase